MAKTRAYYEANREQKLAKYRERVAELPLKLCSCGRPVASRMHDYCVECSSPEAAAERKRKRDAKRMRPRPSPSLRGYGPSHKALRREYARWVAAGNCKCARCGELIAPDEPWDLGHVDGDRSRWSGAEHARCNRATAAHRVQKQTSRSW